MKRVPRLFASLFEVMMGVSDPDLFVAHQAKTHFMLDALPLPEVALRNSFRLSALMAMGVCTIPVPEGIDGPRGVLKQGAMTRFAAINFVSCAWCVRAGKQSQATNTCRYG